MKDSQVFHYSVAGKIPGHL